MQNNEILVSIVINCLNGEKFLKEALTSIKNQKYQNFEVIFWDNFSNDKSKKIFLDFADNRFKYFCSKKKLKLYDARNHALAKCQGELITFLDVDDTWLENKLYEQVKEFKKYNSDIIYSNYYIKKNDNVKLREIKVKKISSDYINHYLKKYDVALLTICIKRSFLNDNIKIFDPNYNIIGDYVFMMKMAPISKISIIHKPLAIYRLHNQNYTILNYIELAMELKHWLKQNHNLKSLKNIKYLEQRLIFYQAIGELDNNNFSNFIRYLFKIKFIRLFIKAIYHIFKKSI
tara:strand:- start:8356 stop:9222 length:867 start_codon:yes stop_codon:yes gene_type:complete